MCGIFGIISKSNINLKDLRLLSKHASQRGKDSSGYIEYFEDKFLISRYDCDINRSIKNINFKNKVFLGHSRLVTNSMIDNQPITKNYISVIHNGIITNFEKLYEKFGFKQDFQIDTEIIIDLIDFFLKKTSDFNSIVESTLSLLEGSASCVVHLHKQGKILLFSNNGSLYSGKKNNDLYISSESFPLKKTQCTQINKVTKNLIIDIPSINKKIPIKDFKISRKNLIPNFHAISGEKNLLHYEINKTPRCAKCILPANFPFISFDKNNICNFCNRYKKKYSNFIDNNKESFQKILSTYKKKDKGIDCIFPLSGGRDSCYGLHIAVNELGLKPITFTYDWGLVTDLARRNISKMCSKLKIENIVVADNIEKKRANVKKNILAWLKKPHLGMVNLFTAGDKHFYRFLDLIKYQNNTDLNIWSYNPFEITHFKHGFLNIKPNFNNKKTYNQGILNQLEYQLKRFKVMSNNISYFNSSLFDTLLGEYSRSIKKHKDYYYLFNYFKWDEKTINNILLNKYDWELSPDTNSTWRIGDGAAPFYNYIYNTMVGFSEFDTFRSNQIREGDLSREEALKLIKIENRPRYQSIKWFLDVIGLNFKDTIGRINEFKYKENNL